MSLSLATHTDPGIWLRYLEEEPAILATALDLMKLGRNRAGR